MQTTIKNDVPDFKTYPVIGSRSAEQVRFLRHDPMPNIEFEHVKAEKQKQAFMREVKQALLVCFVVALFFIWKVNA